MRTTVWGDPKPEEVVAAILNSGIPRVELGERIVSQGKRLIPLEFAQRMNRALISGPWRSEAARLIYALYPEARLLKEFLETILFQAEPVKVVLTRTGAPLAVDPIEIPQTLVSGQSRVFELPALPDVPFLWAPVSGGKVTLTVGNSETTSSFEMGVCPMTNAQITQLVSEVYDNSASHYFSPEGLSIIRKGGVTSPLWWYTGEFNNGPHYPEHPIVGVSVYESEALLRALGMRLATEWEWQRAAEGPTHFVFPWGNEFDPNRLNHSVGRVGRGSMPVNSCIEAEKDGRSPFGIADMAGNVWEWTASHWESDSPYHVLRGGCWYYSRPDGFTVVARGYDHPGFRDENCGVRGVMDLAPLP